MSEVQNTSGIPSIGFIHELLSGRADTDNNSSIFQNELSLVYDLNGFSKNKSSCETCEKNTFDFSMNDSDLPEIPGFIDLNVIGLNPEISELTQKDIDNLLFMINHNSESESKNFGISNHNFSQQPANILQPEQYSSNGVVLNNSDFELLTKIQSKFNYHNNINAPMEKNDNTGIFAFNTNEFDIDDFEIPEEIKQKMKEFEQKNNQLSNINSSSIDQISTNNIVFSNGIESESKSEIKQNSNIRNSFFEFDSKTNQNSLNINEESKPIYSNTKIENNTLDKNAFKSDVNYVVVNSESNNTEAVQPEIADTDLFKNEVEANKPVKIKAGNVDRNLNNIVEINPKAVPNSTPIKNEVVNSVPNISQTIPIEINAEKNIYKPSEFNIKNGETIESNSIINPKVNDANQENTRIENSKVDKNAFKSDVNYVVVNSESNNTEAVQPEIADIDLFKNEVEANKPVKIKAGNVDRNLNNIVEINPKAVPNSTPIKNEVVNSVPNISQTIPIEINAEQNIYKPSEFNIKNGENIESNSIINPKVNDDNQENTNNGSFSSNNNNQNSNFEQFAQDNKQILANSDKKQTTIDGDKSTTVQNEPETIEIQNVKSDVNGSIHSQISKISINSKGNSTTTQVTEFSLVKQIIPEDFPKTSIQLIKNLPENGSGSAKLILQPQALGTVIVEIKMSQNIMQMEVKAETQEAVKLIENQMASLKDKLANNGIIADKIDVSLNQENLQNFGNAGQFNRQSKREDKTARSAFIHSLNGIGTDTQDAETSSIKRNFSKQGSLIETYI